MTFTLSDSAGVGNGGSSHGYAGLIVKLHRLRHRYFQFCRPSGNDDESSTLQGTIEHLNLGIFSVSAVVDLSNLGQVVDGAHVVFYAFTVSNGAAIDAHIVTSAAPVPLPAGLGLLGSALGGLGLMRRRDGRKALAPLS